MNRTKVVVFGATGFIGRNIAQYYANNEDYKVIGTYFNSLPYTYKGLQLVQADLRDALVVNDLVKGADIIIQAAATTSGAKDIVNQPYIHVTDNAVMNSLIFRAAYEYSVKKVIFFSCTVMYQSSDMPLKESDFNANDEIYHNYFGVGWTKVYLEKQAEFYARLGRNQYTILRHSNVYGPHDKYDLDKSHVFGATVNKVMNNQDGVITVWGSGQTGRDLIYIDDLVDAVDKAINYQQKNFGLYNIGCAKAIMIKDLVQEIITASGKSITIEFDKTKPDITTKLCIDCTKAQKEIQWTVQTTLKDGIRKTIQWYTNHIH